MADFSDYANAALPTATSPVSSAPVSYSDYANAHLATNSDSQNYQQAFANAPAPAPQPGFLSQVGSAIKNLFAPGTSDPTSEAIKSDVSNAFNAPAPAKIPITPQSYLTDIYGTLSPNSPSGVQGGIVGDTLNSWINTVDQIKNLPPQPGLARTAAVAQAGLSALGSFFQPISTVFGEAATIPGPVGDLADLVNKVFTVAGKVTGDATGGLVQHSDLLTDQQKAILVPLASNIGALAGQIAAGGATADRFSALKDQTHTFLSKIQEDSRLQELHNNPGVQEAIQKLTEPTKSVPVTSETPTESPVPLKTAEGNPITQQPEPYVPDSQLPTIDAGNVKPTLPTVQTETAPSDNIPSGTRLVVDKSTIAEPAVRPGTETPVVEGRGGVSITNERDTAQTAPTDVSSPKTQNVSPSATEAPKTAVSTPEVPSSAPSETPIVKTGGTTQTLKPIEGTGELKTRGAALSIEAGAIEKGLTDTLGNLPEYQSVKFADMVPKIQKVFAEDPVGARAIAMGEKAAPKGTTPEMFAVTLEKNAHAEGDVQTLQDLANSKLTVAGTTMGQRIASYAQRDEHSPTQAIKEVQAAREAALAQRGATIKQESTARIADSIRKTNTVKNWSDFISSIEC